MSTIASHWRATGWENGVANLRFLAAALALSGSFGIGAAEAKEPAAASDDLPDGPRATTGDRAPPVTPGALGDPATAGVPRISQFGCAGFPRTGTLYLEGTAISSGSTGTFTRLTDGQGRSVDARRQQAYSEALGFDGISGWRRDRSGATHRLNSPVALEMARSQAWLDKRGWCLPDLGGASRAGHRAVTDADVTYNVYRLTPPGARPLELWFDASSGILSRAVLQLKGTRLVHRYSDWRTIPGGPLVPYSQHDEYVEEEETEELRVRQVRVQSPVAPDAFAMPGQPRDHFFRGGQHSTTVTYESDGNVIFIPVRIGGRGPYLFLLDTGGHLHLTSEVAAATGQESKGPITTYGPVAAVASQAVDVAELSIGDAVLLRQHAGVLPLQAFGVDRRPKEPIAGIVGLEIFTRFIVEIDKRRRTVTLWDRSTPPPARGLALPIVFSEDAPIVAGSVEGRRGLFVVDSGNSGSTILQTQWGRRNGLEPVLMRGIPGRAQAIGGAIEQIISRASVGMANLCFPTRSSAFSRVGPQGPAKTKMRLATWARGSSRISIRFGIMNGDASGWSCCRRWRLCRSTERGSGCSRAKTVRSTSLSSIRTRQPRRRA